MILKDKSIILISSERWGKIFISKHNYAIALARRGNKVFFLNPIELSFRPGEVRVAESGVYPDLKVVTYRPYTPIVFKFHLRPVFELLLKWDIRRLVRILKIKPDIVWDFNCAYLYNDLSIFGAPLKIFSPVDRLASDACDKKADLFISISDEILSQFSRKGVPKLKLNHGLGEAFVAAAENEIAVKPRGQTEVGYVGNLTLDSIDRDILLEIITQNPDVIFNFIGPISARNNNLGASNEKDIEVFTDKLKQQKNIVLHGIKSQKEIPEILQKYDIQLLCYKRTSIFKCDNSHKMIEYLSSGKVVVSTYLSVYADSELVEMSEKDNNMQLPSLFKKVVEHIDRYNEYSVQEKRKRFALQNSYDNHLGKIELFILDNGLK